jgi:hypothetical protein
MRGMTLLARSVPLRDVIVVLMVAGLAMAAVGVPRRVLDEAGSQSLAGMLETTRLPVDAVIVQLPVSTRTDPRFAGAHVTSLAEAGAAVTLAADQPLQEVAPYLAEPAFVFDTVRFAVQQVNGATAPLPTFIRLRFALDVEPRMRNLEGRRASTRPETLDGLPLIEVALSEDSLRASRLEVGDVLEVGRDPLDRNATFIPSGLGAVALRIAEAVALPDRDDVVWSGDPTPATGLVVDTSIGADVFLTALLRADQFQLTSAIPATAGLVGVAVFPHRSSWRRRCASSMPPPETSQALGVSPGFGAAFPSCWRWSEIVGRPPNEWWTCWWSAFSAWPRSCRLPSPRSRPNGGGSGLP